MKNTAEFAKRQGRKAPKSVLQHYCISSLRLSRCKHSDYNHISCLPFCLCLRLFHCFHLFSFLRLFLCLCFFYFSFLVSVSVLTLAPFPFFIAPPAVTVQSDSVALTLALHPRPVFISPLLFSLPSHSAPGIALWLLSFSPYESPKG